LTIPDNFADLYNLPPKVLNKIRETLCKKLDISIEGPAYISLYLYDNKTFIVESFLDKETSCKIIAYQAFTKITDLKSNQTYLGELRQSQRKRNIQARNTFDIFLKPHSFRVFRYE
jgi:hypothetical protein